MDQELYIIMQVACLLSLFSHGRLFATPWTIAHQALCPWDSPGKNTGLGCMPCSRGSSQPRDWTWVSYVSFIGKQVPYHKHHLGSSMYHYRMILAYNFWKKLVITYTLFNSLNIWSFEIYNKQFLMTQKNLQTYHKVQEKPHDFLCEMLQQLPQIHLWLNFHPH